MYYQANAVESLSARRAWIEIKYVVKNSDFSGVALRKESVDRNCYHCNDRSDFRLSLSARRAWIEISSGVDFAEDWLVALRKESVDRNKRRVVGQCVQLRRSPQGERG